MTNPRYIVVTDGDHEGWYTDGNLVFEGFAGQDPPEMGREFYFPRDEAKVYALTIRGANRMLLTMKFLETLDEWITDDIEGL